MGHAVHAAEAVGDERDTRPVAVVARQLQLLAPQEGGRGGVRDRRHAGVEELGGGATEVRKPALLDHGHGVVHDPGEFALVDPARAAVEVLVADVAVLEMLDEPALVDLQVHRPKPGAQQRERVPRPEVTLRLARADVALAHHALDDLDHRKRVRTVLLLTVSERPDRERHRRVRPLGRAALVTVGNGVAGADLGEELNCVAGSGRLREGAADVDSGVVVGAADRGAAMRLDVDEGRQVQLLGAGPVARLPDRKQLREAAAVTRRERRLDREERMREGGRDPTIVQVLRARLDA